MRISDWSSDVCSSDLKGLRQALGLRLLGKAEVDAPLAAVAQQVAEQMLLVRRGDNEDVADARHHQHRSEEHTSELQSLMRISYAVFCLKKKKTQHTKYKDTSAHITL